MDVLLPELLRELARLLQRRAVTHRGQRHGVAARRVEPEERQMTQLRAFVLRPPIAPHANRRARVPLVEVRFSQRRGVVEAKDADARQRRRREDSPRFLRLVGGQEQRGLRVDLERGARDEVASVDGFAKLSVAYPFELAKLSETQAAEGGFHAAVAEIAHVARTALAQDLVGALEVADAITPQPRRVADADREVSVDALKPVRVVVPLG